MVSEHIDKDEWVNLDDLLKLRQNVRLLDEGGWNEDIKAIPVEAIKGLAKLDIVRCKDCKYYKEQVLIGKCCCRTFMNFQMNDNDFCSYGVKEE